MTSSDDFDHESDQDAMLQEWLSPLKGFEPSVEGRVSNRLAVAQALLSLKHKEEKRHRPWWWGSVSVPVPIAAALLITVGLTWVWAYRDRHDRPAGVVPQSPEMRSISAVQAPRLPPSSIVGRPITGHSESEIYLCGVGRLSSESDNFIQE